MDDNEFRDRADHALEDLHRRLNAAADSLDFEADFNAGALTIEFENPPAKFVVSPNSPVQQIWVSAHMKSHKLAWDSARREFAAEGKTLRQLIADAIGQQLATEVKL